MDRKSTGQNFYSGPLAWGALAIGLAALGTSVTLSEAWSEYNGQNVVMSWLMAVVFVGFTNLVFEVGWGLFVRGRRGRLTIRSYKGEDFKEGLKIVRYRYLGGVACIALSLLLETYNITAIVGAQYNALVTVRVKAPEVVAEQTTDDVQTRVDLQTDAKAKAEAENAQLKKDFDITTAIYKTHLKEFPNLKPSELDALPVTVQYNNEKSLYEANKKRNDDKIEVARLALLTLAVEKTQARNVGKSNQALFHGSVYTYLKGVTGIDEIYLQFALTALPSLFLGLISCLSLAFFLYRKTDSSEQGVKK